MAACPPHTPTAPPSCCACTPPRRSSSWRTSGTSRAPAPSGRSTDRPPVLGVSGPLDEPGGFELVDDGDDEGRHDAEHPGGLLLGSRLVGHRGPRAPCSRDLGIPLTGVPTQIAAIADVPDRDTGIASGLINASYQIGGALGPAIATTFANARAEDLAADGTPARVALAGAYERGLTVTVVLAGLTLIVALVGMPRLRPTADQLAAAAVPA